MARVIKIIKSPWYWQRDRHIDQPKKKKSRIIQICLPKTSRYSYRYAHLIFDIGPKQFNGERIVFSTNGIGTTDHPKANNMNFSLNLTHYNCT